MNPGRHVNKLPANCSHRQQESSSKYPNDLFESDKIVRKYGRMAQLVEHIVHIDGVTGSSPVATTKIPGSTAFPGISSCRAEVKITLETDQLQPSPLLGIVLHFAKIRTIRYEGVQVYFIE